MKKIVSVLGLMAAGLLMANLAAAPAVAGDGPYVVRGNQHMLIGITLDEATVRAALPAGLEPAEGITGGINVYTSKGSEDVAAYGRSYVWVDVKGYDSINGGLGRYILWSATSTGPDKLKKAGYMEVQGDTSVSLDGRNIAGSTMVGGQKIMSTAIMLNEDGKCGPAAGSLNYPSLPDAGGKLMVTQYTFTAKICGAKPVSAEIQVDAGHPLAKFKPTKVVWAAYAKDLSFSGSPLMPIKMASQ